MQYTVKIEGVWKQYTTLFDIYLPPEPKLKGEVQQQK